MRLSTLNPKRKNRADLKEFARFEIAKIDEIAPKIGEDEELVHFKNHFQKEKIEQAMQKRVLFLIWKAA